MKSRIISMVVVFCILAGMMTACGKTKSESAQKKAEISVPEKLEWKERNCITSQTTYGRKQAECMCTTYEGITYCFGKESFQEENATKFVKAAMELVAYADELFEVTEHRKEIFLNVPEAKEKLTVSDSVEFDVLWKVLKQVHKVNSGEQYGLFYLYSVEQGLIKERAISKKEIKSYFTSEKNQLLLDFCLPMLEENFFDAEQVQMTCEAAKSFATWYEKNYSYNKYEKMCKQIATDSYKKDVLEKEKNNWLKSLGCDFTYREFGKVPFVSTERTTAYNNSGRTKDKTELVGEYEIDCADAVWVWTKATADKIGYREMVKGYIELEPLRKEDFEGAREFLKDYLPDTIRPIEIYPYMNGEKSNRAGAYNSNGAIVLFKNWDQAAAALLHEYSHYLTMGAEKLLHSDYGVYEEWLAEWLAAYQLTNREREKVRYLIEEEYLTMVGDGNKETAKAMSISELEYGKFLAEKNKRTGDIKSYSYGERATVCKYIYESYGMQKLEELVNTDGEFEKVLGKPLEQLYEETKVWVVEQLNPAKKSSQKSIK